MRKLMIPSIALLMSTAAVAAHESARPPPAVAALLDLEMQQESDGCRDGSGFVTLHQKTPCSLELMHKYQLQLQNLGWCQGKEGQPHYQWVWHECGPDSLRVEGAISPTPQVASTPWSRLYDAMAVSPGRLSGPQRDCLMKQSISASGVLNNQHAIDDCKIPGGLIAPAISMIGGLKSRGELIETPWSEEHCQPNYTGFECTYQGVTVKFR